MSFGIRVVSSGGEAIFDSRTKKYYTLVGKMLSRDQPYEYGAIVYINPPSMYNPTNSIFVLKPFQGVNSGGNLMWVGVIPPAAALYNLRFATTDGTGYAPTYPPVEVYVYTTLPVSASSDFGLEVKDSSGQISFNTSQSSLTLQITEQINGGVLTGKLNTHPANGVIISSSFYQAVASGPGHVSPQLAVFRTESNNIYSDIQTVRRSINTPGGFSFTNTSLALVSLPEWDPPIIDW